MISTLTLKRRALATVCAIQPERLSILTKYDAGTVGRRDMRPVAVREGPDSPSSVAGEERATDGLKRRDDDSSHDTDVVARFSRDGLSGTDLY